RRQQPAVLLESAVMARRDLSLLDERRCSSHAGRKQSGQANCASRAPRGRSLCVPERHAFRGDICQDAPGRRPRVRRAGAENLGYAVTPRQHIPHRSRTTPTVSRSRGRCAECGRRVFLLTEKAFKQKPRKRGGFENDSDADNRSAGERCKQDTPSGASCASLLLPGCLPLENPTSTHDSQEAVVACMYTACVCMRLGFPSAVCVRPQRPGVDLLLSL
ncbi:Rab18/RabC-family small GTPase, partial [Toxoplasma gondii FOU]